MPPPGLSLTREVQQSFQIAKTFDRNSRDINSISFNGDGKLMVTTSEDDSINLYDCEVGEHVQTLHSKKYGASLARFTHGGSTIIHASTKENDTIRYLSLHDNKYLRYFVGHKKRVTALSMSPVSDQFLSASEDHSVRLWDLRSTNCSGVIQARSPTVGAFGPKGVIFAVGVGSTIKLYDARKYETGPFDSIPVAEGGDMDQLQISPDSKHIMVRKAGRIIIFDAYSGARKYDLGKNVTTACFSPCGHFVYGGCTNMETNESHIIVWSTHTGDDVARHIEHRRPITALEFNPKLMMIASADTELNFWISTLKA
mmetsp:Transcript_21279/g.55528  ORF Transcript_21279/g.55528 Transcript_21279/m.55528 type:complete len:313 (+) Transcript_21279:297-1235(+)